MSLYINKSNQELLWNTVQKLKAIEKIDNKEKWFRSVIEVFHNKYGNIHDFELLRKINLETIQYMLESQNLYNHELPYLNNDLHIKHPIILSKEEEKMKTQELYNLAFQEKQKQFELFHSKPPLPELDFTEKLDDEPISNMEELIEKQRKERAEDYSLPVLEYNPIKL